MSELKLGIYVEILFIITCIGVVTDVEDVGSTVAQWLALLPHSKKALCSNPGNSRSFQVLSVWSLHVLLVPAWVYSGYSGFPHHHKDMHCIASYGYE